MKYFGTDGIRGVYGKDITRELCFKAGAAVGSSFGGSCVVARDSRISGSVISEAFINGLLSAGANALNAGILPTPAVSFLVKTLKASCGVMISASHNPPEYNGIKVFGAGGIKINSAKEQRLEFSIDSPVNAHVGGFCTELNEGKQLYIDSLIKPKHDFSGFKVALDSGNGAVGDIAAEVFRSFGARVLSINSDKNGAKINQDCGALFIDKLAQSYKGYDFVFGFDGDGDRMACSYKGDVLDGDSVLYSLSRSRTVKDGVVVGTVMSNSALEDKLVLDGKKLLRTQVGDKNILQLMLKNGFNLGGEQSGHYIFYPESVSGDGILAALNLTAAALESGITRLNLTPQKTVSASVDFDALKNIELKRLINAHAKKLKRLLVRKSGTEPKIRIMAEDPDAQLIDKAIEEILRLIEKQKEQGE